MSARGRLLDELESYRPRGLSGGAAHPGLRWRPTRLGARVPFFFKQWGGVRKKEAGRELDGRTWDEMPEVSRG